jgi:hypothetical protein
MACGRHNKQNQMSANVNNPISRGLGLGNLEMNERFAALVELMGEDKLLHGKE